MSGLGIKIEKDGDIFIQHSRNGKLNGPCTEFSWDGSIQEGYYKNNKRIGPWMKTTKDGNITS